jgi:hypothetical protein
MLIIGSGLLGLLICGAGFFAGRYLYLAFSTRRLGRWWFAAELLVAVIGLLLGIFLANVIYPSSPTMRIVGFPFMSAIFQLSDGRWLDFVGPLTLPAAFGNMIVGFVVPQILFALVVRRRLSREQII